MPSGCLWHLRTQVCDWRSGALPGQREEGLVWPPWAAACALLAGPVCRAQPVPVGSGGGFTTDQLLPRADTSHWVLGEPQDVPVWVGTGPTLCRLRASPKSHVLGICLLDSRLRASSGCLPPLAQARAVPGGVWGRWRARSGLRARDWAGVWKPDLGPCSGGELGLGRGTRQLGSLGPAPRERDPEPSAR